ncbi:MAG TPA: DUF4123 domain-containing protein [Gemmobacter sp.]|nr:DUF4123 domain-containing protein [Gemmobacter sp.]
MFTYLGHCHAMRQGAHMRFVAAVFCADRGEFEAPVRTELAARGYQLEGCDTVLPADDWIALHPASNGKQLAAMVGLDRPVVLSDMRPVEYIDLVEPLGSQMGAASIKTVPDALHALLFGQPEAPADGARKATAAEAAALPLLGTYALLDAAKMPYLLTSLLDRSGLRHQSLFQGEGQEQLGEYAPYLVELKDGSDFTRRLFSSQKGAGGLWERDLGIYLRSRAGFDALRKHLRKFTRVEDESGRWYFFRFWEPAVATDHFHGISGDAQRYAGWFGANGQALVEAYVTPDPDQCCVTVFRPVTPAAASAVPRVLLKQDVEALCRRRVDRDLTEVAALMRQTFPEQAARMDDEALDRQIRRSASRAQDFQIRQRANVFRLAAWDLHSDGAFERGDPENRLRTILQSDASEADKMRLLAERLAELGDGG